MNEEAITNRIDELYNYIQLVENNYQYHTNWLLGILAFVVTAAGASLYVLARQWFNSTVKKEIEDAEERIGEQLKREINNEFNNHYQSYSMTITAGSVIYLPYEPIREGVHPSVFVRAHDPEDKYKVEVLEDEKKIKITNENHESNDKIKDIPLDLLILKAKVKM